MTFPCGHIVGSENEVSYLCTNEFKHQGECFNEEFTALRMVKIEAAIRQVSTRPELNLLNREWWRSYFKLKEAANDRQNESVDCPRCQGQCS